MRWKVERVSERFGSVIPAAVLMVALAITAAGWFALERNRIVQARAQFDRRTESAVAALRARMLAYEQILRSGAARIASSAAVSREEWRDFIGFLQVGERYPGIKSVGYAKRSGASFPIVLNEPHTGGNARALGVDLFADPTLRGAMELARSSGDVAISGRVLLAGAGFDGAQPGDAGFVAFAPIFHGEALDGFVFSPLRVPELMRGILDTGVLRMLDMRIHDEPGASPAHELIDTRLSAESFAEPVAPLFRRVVGFPMPGRTWSIEFTSRPDFDAALARDRPWGELACGIVASFVVFLLTGALMTTLKRAHHLSMRDPLTGLYNRRYLDETMEREVVRAHRSGEGMGVIVLDIDHFKRLNDTFGHDAGDLVLGRMGELLRKATRGSDIACRFGGEEFAVILPGATLAVARNRAEAIRAAFEAMPIRFDGHLLEPITVSAGVSALASEDHNWVQVVQQADRALYTAKQAGRNRVLAAAPE
jgi:diguanylate cyclase (GGDEF)-like protein